MPVHIEDLQVSLTTVAGDLPLTEQQLQQIAEQVLAIIAHRQRDTRRGAEATTVRTTARPAPAVECPR